MISFRAHLNHLNIRSEIWRRSLIWMNVWPHEHGGTKTDHFTRENLNNSTRHFTKAPSEKSTIWLEGFPKMKLHQENQYETIVWAALNLQTNLLIACVEDPIQCRRVLIRIASSSNWLKFHVSHTHTHPHTHAHPHPRTHACMHTRTHAPTPTHPPTHTHTHTHTHTRTHTHTVWQ